MKARGSSVVIQCVVCGVNRRVQASQVERARTCSRECSAKRRSSKVSLSCSVCGVQFLRKRSEGGRYCSRHCSVAAQRQRKEANSERTALRLRAKTMWTAINLRCGCGKYRHLDPDNPKSRAYDDVIIEFTYQELKAWVIERGSEIQALSRPSIDRIDKSLGYSLGNIQVIELTDNIIKDKTVFRDGEGRCWSCGETKREDQFVRSNRTRSGRISICKPCETKRTSARYRRLKGAM